MEYYVIRSSPQLTLLTTSETHTIKDYETVTKEITLLREKRD